MDILNSKVYRIVEFAIDLVLLNLVWLVACLPVVTAFPATAGMFGVVRDWIRGTDDGVIAPFGRHFKSNFVQSLGIGFLWLIISSILVVDFILLGSIDGWWKVPLLGMLLLATTCFCITSVFLFPVMLNYYGNWRLVIKNSFLIALSQPGTTIPCVLILALALVVLYFVPIVSLLLGSTTAYALYALCGRAFGRIEARKGLKPEAINESSL